MNLHARDESSGYGIADGQAGMGISARIYHQGFVLARRLLNFGYYLSFAIELENIHFEAALSGKSPYFLVYLFQGEPTIYLRLSLAQEVQVWAVYNQHLHHFTLNRQKATLRSFSSELSSPEAKDIWINNIVNVSQLCALQRTIQRGACQGQIKIG